jgi:riboflavin synthase
MFTGLIREFAEVSAFSNGVLTIKAKHRPKLGDSIAINGACLTVIEVGSKGFKLELSHESIKLLATENLQGRVHMEPAMRLGDRIEGHIVQGHVDCQGEIERIEKQGASLDFYIAIPTAFQKFIIPKGSITIDGVSLTINDQTASGFRLTIIPHTLKHTLFESYQVGRGVNVETDMFARYLYHLFNKEGKQQLSWSEIDAMQAMF